MSYGVLLCCAKIGNSHILRVLQMVLSLEGDPINNEIISFKYVITEKTFTSK